MTITVKSLHIHHLSCLYVCANVNTCVLSCVQLFVTSWTIVCQVPLSVEFSRQAYMSPIKDVMISTSQTVLLLLSHFSRVQLCNPIDSSPPGCSVPGILQARILEWVAISFSNACMHANSLQLCPTLWTAAHQAPLSTGSSRQEYQRGLPRPSPTDNEGDINDKCGKELKPIKTVSYKCSGKNLNH